MRRSLRAVVGVVVLALAACGPGDGTERDGTEREGTDRGALDPEAPWRTSTDPVEVGGLVWLGDTTVHLADGATVELDDATQSYVVAGDGVFWLVDDGSEAQAVRFTDVEGRTTDTGLRLIPESLRASPDGRYLAGVDLSLSDEEDRFGTPLATALVLDLSNGEEVVRSTDGMGDAGSDDLADLYAETEIGAVALTDDEAVVDTVEGPVSYDLATGGAEPLGEDADVPGPPEDDPAPASPDGRWRVVDAPGLTDRIESTDGESVTPDTGTDRWTFDRWVDDTTIVGTAVDGPGGGPRLTPADRTTLMTCVVPSGACDVREESTGQLVFYPRGTSAAGGVQLQDGGAS